jgi:hypothetical protein
MSVAARAASAEGAWVVLKFGGTSVSNRANWERIAAVVRARLATGARVMVVHSAITGITDRLEKLLAAALANDYGRRLRCDRCPAPAARRRSRPRAQHRSCWRILPNSRQVAAGIALMGEVSDRVRARVMAMGELMATEIGAGFLQAQDLAAHWLDARSMLRSEERRRRDRARVVPVRDLQFRAGSRGLEQRLDAFGRVVITQGFIASDAARPDGAAGPRRLRHLGRVPRRQAAGRPARDLDRRARHVQRQSALDADRAPAALRSATRKRRRSPRRAPRSCTRAASCRRGSTRSRCMSTRPRRRSSRARC